MTMPRADDRYEAQRRDLNGRAFPSAPALRRTAGIDLAFVQDGCALVIIERGDQAITVPDFELLMPRPGAPLDPVSTCEAYCARIAAAGCKHVVADVHYLELIRQATNKHGLSLQVAPASDARTRAFVTLRHYTRARSIQLPPAIAAHLRPIELRVSGGGGQSIVAPRAPGQGHADLAFALAAAIHSDTARHGVLGLTPTVPMSHRGKWASP